MTADRGIPLAQARMLAADPSLSPNVYARLANNFPEVWPELLSNSSLSADLRTWIESSMAAAQRAAQPTSSVESEVVVAGAGAVAAPAVAVKERPAKKRTRLRRRRQSAFAKFVWILLPPVVIIALLYTGVQAAVRSVPEVGVISTRTFFEPSSDRAWEQDLSTRGSAKCIDYSFQTYDQDLALVLIQNDWANEDCRDEEHPAPSTLMLVNTRSGVASWKVNLTDELSWTEKWRAELLSMPALDQIMVRYTDVTGKDVADDNEVVDKSDNRKMKSLVPYSPLNGRVSDTSIASMPDSPLLQAPVLEAIQIPSDTKNIILMSNGNKKDFRYSKYRAKKLTDSEWSYESNLKPLGGNALIGPWLLLGRENDDKPMAVSVSSGSARSWQGPAGGKIYRVAGTLIHIKGDGTSESISNESAQGGLDGHDVTVTGLSESGGVVWKKKSRGYALAQYTPTSTLDNRREYSGLYLLSGKKNKTLARVNPASGASVWTITPDAAHYEVARGENAAQGVLYFTAKKDSESKSLVFVGLADGKVSKRLAISGKSERVDGSTAGQVYLVDDPDRSRFYNNAENGDSTTSDGKDRSDDTRTCAAAFNPPTVKPLWSWECDGNQHVLLLGGNWVVFDEKPDEQKLIRFKPVVL